MQHFFTVSSVARRFGIQPRKISDLFYARRLSDADCPVVDGRRVIPESYLPQLELTLRECGLLDSGEPANV